MSSAMLRLLNVYTTQQQFFNYTPLLSKKLLKWSKHKEKQRNPKQFHCHSFANVHTVFSLRAYKRPDMYNW